MLKFHSAGRMHIFGHVVIGSDGVYLALRISGSIISKEDRMN